MTIRRYGRSRPAEWPERTGKMRKGEMRVGKATKRRAREGSKRKGGQGKDDRVIRKAAREAREAAEAMRKRQAETRATERKRQMEEQERWQRHCGFGAETETRRRQHSPSNSTRTKTHQAGMSSCGHSGWWSKVESRTPCPKCLDVWTYLLQYPGCNIKACPKCQAAMRPRPPRKRATTNPRSRRHERTPS